MENLIVKKVDLFGDVVAATQDKDGNIWAGVSYFCKALGMNKGQKDRQTTNVQKDETLKRGCRKFAAGVFDPSNEAVGIKIDFIPLWLAKMSITDKTKQGNPDLADKLLKYQLQAKDILAAAFLPKQGTPPRTAQEQIFLLAQGAVELYERVEGVEGRIEELENTMNLDHGQQYFLEKTVNKTVLSILGGKESSAYKHIGRKVFAECNGDLKAYFKVNARGNVPKKRYEEAITYAENWKPCTNTLMQIEMLNAQP